MKSRIFTAYFLLLVVLISLPQLRRAHIGANTIARLATIESLVERRTYAIDDSSLPPTCDKVRVGGRFYGCQPPVLQTAVAPLYLLLRLAGLSMSRQPRLVYALLTIFIVGVPSGLMMALFYAMMSDAGLDARRSLLATVTFGLGTLVFPYSTILNSHIIGGALIFFSLYVAFRGLGPWRAFFAGLFLGGAATIDIPPGGVFSLLFFLYLLLGRARRRFLLPAALGWFPPFVLHCAVNVSILGTLLPAGLLPEYFDYPGSIFTGENLSGVASHPSAAAFLGYAYHCLVGRRGLFSYNPVLLFPLATLVAAAFAGRRGRFRDLSVLVLTSTVLTVLYYLMKTVNYGGWSYGMRFFVPLIPPVAIYMGPFLAVRRSLLIRSLFTAALVFSVTASLVGVLNPLSDVAIGANPAINNVVMAFGNLSLRLPPIMAGLAMNEAGGDGEALYQLGEKFDLYGWKEMARDAALRAVRAAPASPAPRLSLANRHYDLGELALARREYGYIRRHCPGYVSAVHDYDIARRVNVIRVSDEDVAARRNMAHLLIAEGRSTEAAELIRDYLDNSADRAKERFRRRCGDSAVEVVYPPSVSGLSDLLVRLEGGRGDSAVPRTQ